MLPANINQTIDDISIARMSSYHSFFSNISQQEAYGLYCWNEALSSALFRLISITEVVLRNRFHEAFSQEVSNPQSIGAPTANDWYNYISLNSKSASKIQKVTHRWANGGWTPKHPLPTSNDVVSQMTFGFWPALLNQQSIVNWGNVLPNIVPYHRYKTYAHWNSTHNRGVLWARLDMVNKIRNRIAHFEPVWKQGNLIEERRRTQNSPPLTIDIAAPTDTAGAIAMLNLKHQRIVELLRWLSKDRAQDYLSSYIHDHFTWVCSIEGFESYKNLKVGSELPVSKFKRELNSIVRRQDKVKVTRCNTDYGTFYPGKR
ncbi:Abi family protein [Neptuniibacter marinus]|uniref:Abi family protein n=1 Tax=Neptuniibacter marinus TaxID=1806670 RepID=UPI00082CC735|nr:Abi family protein [Neptuniibacter marinus]